MIAWQAIHSAIRAWVVAAAPGWSVIWSQQGGDRPVAPYIALRLREVRQVGQDWIDVVDAASPAPGAEIEHRVRGQRVVLLGIQAFAGAATGVHAPAAVLDAIRTAARLPSVHSELDAAGVGVLGFGAAQSIDGLVGATVFEPRGVMDARLMIVSEVSEFSTYIERVEVTNEITGATTEVP